MLYPMGYNKRPEGSSACSAGMNLVRTLGNQPGFIVKCETSIAVVRGNGGLAFFIGTVII